MPKFHCATDKEIKSGDTTDIYFVRTGRVLKAKKLANTHVVAEVTVGGFPCDWPWGILCGIEEETHLFEGCTGVDVYSMPEGSVFYHQGNNGVREPVMFIEGRYGDFCTLETPLLGLICQASGVATQAARIKKTAGEKPVIAFGIRRMHPAISPMIDRAAYLGGCDGVSSLSGAKLIGVEPTGTMPHALVVTFGNQVKAWRAFDEVMPLEVPRVALIDTYYDEKAEAVMAAETLKERLEAVRLDTPSSRRGNFVDLVKEIRWELDVRGYKHVKIFVSGGLDADNISALSRAGANVFGVGTAISNAPTINFAMDIIEVEGRPAAKRGRFSQRKQVWRCPSCLQDTILPFTAVEPTCSTCGGQTQSMLKPLIKDGKIVAKLSKPSEIRQLVLKQLKKLTFIH